MKHLVRFWAAPLLAAALALCLAGCGGTGLNSFTWFVEDLPTNLDPQLAAASADVIACTNLYGGLVRRSPEGGVVPDLASDYTVSADGLQYTFTIREGLTYTGPRGEATGYAITAEDFVFALRRVFRPETRSPYAAEFAAIAGSAQVLAGALPETALGVAATGPLTLTITLSEPDPSFLSKLALPGAMPCDEAFFASTGGTYGLTTDSTLASGSFYIYNWTSSGLFLRRAPDGAHIDSLRLVQNTSATAMTAEELIVNERCSAALDTTASDTALRAVTYTDTTWCLLFNTASVLDNAVVRRAMAASAMAAGTVPNGPLYAAAQGLVPAGAQVDGQDYRAAGQYPGPAISQQEREQARAALQTGDQSRVTLLLPAGSGLEQLAGAINSRWQQELGFFISVEQAGQEDFDARLAAGDYTIALAPVAMGSGDVLRLLGGFGAGGLTGYANPEYAALLARAATVSGSERCALLAECERMLLEDAAVAPLFAQNKRLLLADGIEGLVFDPYGPVLDVTFTTRQ